MDNQNTNIAKSLKQVAQWLIENHDDPQKMLKNTKANSETHLYFSSQKDNFELLDTFVHQSMPPSTKTAPLYRTHDKIGRTGLLVTFKTQTEQRTYIDQLSLAVKQVELEAKNKYMDNVVGDFLATPPLYVMASSSNIPVPTVNIAYQPDMFDPLLKLLSSDGMKPYRELDSGSDLLNSSKYDKVIGLINKVEAGIKEVRGFKNIDASHAGSAANVKDRLKDSCSDLRDFLENEQVHITRAMKQRPAEFPGVKTWIDDTIDRLTNVEQELNTQVQNFYQQKIAEKKASSIERL